jgi:hypothetical protein
VLSLAPKNLLEPLLKESRNLILFYLYKIDNGMGMRG